MKPEMHEILTTVRERAIKDFVDWMYQEGWVNLDYTNRNELWKAYQRHLLTSETGAGEVHTSRR